MTRIALLAALAYPALALPGAENQKPLFEIEKVQHIDHFVGSKAAKERLAQQGFVVTDQQFKQIFEAYISCPLPKIVTTDSAWHAYHVLLEEGVRRLAENEAPRLREFSASLMAAALQASAEQPEIHLDLARFAGVGLALQDPKATETMDPRIAADVRTALTTLQATQEPRRLLFFGLPLSGQSISATGLYVKSESLRACFAARRWYATCAFRAISRAETERAVRLALLIERSPELKKRYAELSEPYDRLVGPCDDADVRAYAALARKVVGGDAGDMAGNMEAFSAEVRKLPPPLVNDQYLTPDQYARAAEETRGFRLLPSRRLPSAVIFQNTIDPAVPGRMRPSGVDLLATGTLASEAGRRALATLVKNERTAQAIAAVQEGGIPDSLHGQALRLLAALTEPLPPTAPEALRTSAWQDRQLWTQLGAWAEERHTWALQAKLTAHYLGETREDPGLVEPYPRFFSGLGQLARKAGAILRDVAPPPPLDPRQAGAFLLESLELMEKVRAGAVERDDSKMARIENLFEVLEAYFTGRNLQERDFEKTVQELKGLAGRWAQGGEVTEADRALLRLQQGEQADLPKLLGDFAQLCDRLSGIADKVSKGQPLDEEDGRLIENYGIALARFHFYRGNSWLVPRDDFALVTPVFSSPVRGEVLHAGLARPEALYVIAEFEGRPTLYRGGVLSYREFARPAAQPLDDDAWRIEVARGAIEPPPVFTQSFRVPIDEGEVVAMIKAGGTYAALDTLPGRGITRAIIERLEHPTGPKSDTAWLAERLRCRVKAEDAGDLVRVLSKTDSKYVGDVALALAGLPWKPHGEELVALLSHESPQRADAAAYILSRRPEDINAEALSRAFASQSVRAKRLYCFLFGQLRAPGQPVLDAWKAAMADRSAGVRYEAIRSMVQGKLKAAELTDKLMGCLDDPNERVAAAAAAVLVSLEVKEAAPALLARLQRGTDATEAAPGLADSRHEVVLNDASNYSGYTDLMVLSHRGEMSEALSDNLRVSLIRGLGCLRHAPAKAPLEALLRSSDGWSALNALAKIDPGGQSERLVQVAFDHQVPTRFRQGALRRVARSDDAEMAKRIAPLLDEKTECEGGQGDEHWRICDEAANALAELMKRDERLSEKSDRKTKDAFVRAAKEWVGRKQ